MSAYEIHRTVAEQALPIASLTIEPWPVIGEVNYIDSEGDVGGAIVRD